MPSMSRRPAPSSSSALYATLVLFLVAMPSPIAAQAPPSSVTAGERLRLRSSSGTRYTGRLVTLDRDSLVFRSDDDAARTITLPRDGLEIAVSAGRHRRWASGMGLGLLVGAVGGAVDGAATYEPCTGWCLFTPSSREENAVVNAAAVGLLGMLAGGVVGAFFETERWHPVTLAGDAVHVGLRPTTQGVAIHLAFE